MRNVFVLLLLSLPLICYSDTGCDTNDFIVLQALSEKDSIGKSEFDTAFLITQRLHANRCVDHWNTSITYLFGKVCLGYNNKEAVTSYIQYLYLNNGSSEEQLSFSFEKLFVKYPRWVLEEVHGRSDPLLGYLAWSFLNNRYYSAEDPFEQEPNKALIVYDNPPKAILTTGNYQEIFFSLNPVFKDLYKEYKHEFDSIFEDIEGELQD